MKLFSITILTAIVLLGFTANLIAQKKYGNEWIDPSKVYLKLKVAKDGIYKVSYEELVAVGFQNGSFDGSALKLINFGKEQPIYVNDNNFEAGDYFEFYGEKNRIGLDSLLFDDWKKDLLNPEYSFVNDTNAYFLTLSPETSNLRFTNVNNDYSNVTQAPFPYYLHQEKVVYTSSYFKNADSQIRFSNFEPSEGYGNAISSESNVTFNTSEVVSSGPQPNIAFRLGLNAQLSRLEISFNNTLKDTKILSPQKTNQFLYTLDPSEIKSTNTLKLKNTYSANDKHILAYAELNYPRALKFGNKSEYSFVMSSSQQLRLLEIEDFKSNTGEVILYDITKNLRYNTNIKTSKIQALIKPSQEENRYLLINSNEGSQKVPSIVVFNPKKFENKDQEYIIISNKALYENGPNYVQEYADYRSSKIGGNYNTEIIEIQDIYDHFGYGIDRHFIGIKQLALYMKDQWPTVEFVFIIGKGLEYPYHRTTNDIINNNNRIFFVPTFGFSASDHLLFSEKNYPDPFFGIGRLAAKSRDDIKNYLEKIKQYDLSKFGNQTIKDKLWMKNVIHLGGGTNPEEKSRFKSILSSMEDKIKQPMLGMNVSSHYKSSTDVLQSVTTDRIKNDINNGVSIITFFGHSAAGTWEFSLENPRDYENYGKYPIINSLGCYSGNVHGLASGISEFFVLEKDKGSIAFLASTSTALASDLSTFGNDQYWQLGNESYDIALGKIIKKIAQKFHLSSGATLALYQQLTFHGDPAVKVNQADGPDFTFNFKSTNVSPSLINSSTKTFDIEFEIVNLGKAISDSMDIRLFHQLPDGKLIDTIYRRIATPYYSSTHQVTFTNPGIEGIGKNVIFGEIDFTQKIDELPTQGAENNNKLLDDENNGFEFYILDDTAFPIYPTQYGILTDANQTLKASTSNAFLPSKNYIVQIDTTELFNSSLKISQVINSSGGLIEWKPNINYTPNKVYYWRISPDSIGSEAGNLWQSSSFVYLPGSFDGWNHSHYFQYVKNNQDKLINIGEDRKFSFPYLERTIRIVNAIYVPGQVGYGVNLDDFAGQIRPWNFVSEGAIGVAIASPITGGHIGNSNGNYGSIATTNSGGNFCFAFNTTTPQQRLNLMNFLENNIPEGFYTSIFTVLTSQNNDLHTEDWASDSLIYGKNLFSVLEKLGSTKCRLLEKNGTVPYNFMLVYKGEVKAESCANTKDETIQTKMFIPIQETSGILKTIAVGPSSKWYNLVYKTKNSEPSDTVKINVIGIRANGSESNILVGSSLTDINLNNISTDSFPYLRIELLEKDEIMKTPVQLEYLRVFYDGLQEIALDPKNYFSIYSDSIKQGDSFKIGFAVKNLTSSKTDSIDVKYSIINLSNNQQILEGRTYRKMERFDTIQINFNKRILENPGEYIFVAEANPNRRFYENFYFNNIGKKTFKVVADDTNPLLKVYFDGQQIMDGDIISPTPFIKIVLNDDNLLLPLDDAQLFEIQLSKGINTKEDISMTDPRINFIPSTSPNKNEAEIHFNPNLTTGEYKLVVQARDKTGNKSGQNSYQVNFDVIEEASVSNVLNYPNPFSTSTQFIFTLTGREIPSNFSITIMTLSGKVVKEITQAEFGNIHIGINKSEYKWDGTDDYGNKLANGVYLYKANFKDSENKDYKSFQQVNNKLDKYFTNGFGKLVIIR